METLPAKKELQLSAGLPGSGLLLLNVSRLVAQKDHALLLKGFSEFLEAGIEATLCIIGGGPCENSLAELAAHLGISDRVIFFGHQQDVVRYYKMADVFVSTSRIEGFSNALLEALASGLPAVATKTAGTEEIIENGKNGFFIEPRTPEAVCASLRACTAADWQTLSEASRRSVEQFDIVKTVHEYEALFDEAVQ
jgi:glycosyltransferase involved in cell wall biosynthesis